MAQAIKWQIPFKSLNGTAYTVNVYDEDYEDSVITLTGASEPFVTDEDTDEDAFLAVRTQSGYLRIVAQNESDLDIIRTMSGSIRYISLTDGDDNIVWHGYIQPQTFSQSWAPLPYEIAIPVESSLSHLSSIDYVPEKENIKVKAAIQSILGNIPNFGLVYMQNSSIDVLNSQFNDSLYISEDDEKVSRLGVNANLTPPEQKTDCLEVLTNICEYFGLTLREHGTKYLFTYPGSTQDYVVLNGSYSNTENHVSQELPQVKSASNNEDFLDGRRFIDITEKPTPEESIIDADASHYDATGSTIKQGAYSDFGNYDIAKDYLDQTLVKSYQWKTPASPVALAHTCLFGTYSGGNSACGGNILRVIQDQPYADTLTDDDDAKSGFGILNSDSITEGSYVKAVEISTSRTIYGKEYPKGLKLVGNLEVGTVSGWEGSSTLYVSIKWGNKYLSYPASETSTIDPSWVTTEKYIKLTGEKIHRGHIKRTIGSTIYANKIKDYMYIPTDSTLEGVITITFYACKHPSYVFVSDVELSAIGNNKVLFDPCVDLSQNCFRYNIGVYSDTYDRELFFCSRMHDEQTGKEFMRDQNNNFYNGQPETALLNALKAWYGRSTKQLTIDVDDEDFSPLNTIEVGDEFYTIISASRNYRDNTVQLQLQLNP